MFYNITQFSTESLKDQILEQTIAKACCGEITSGEELPPIGKFARDFHVSRATVKKAYEKMTELGILEKRKGESFILKSLSKEEISRLPMKVEPDNIIKKMNKIRDIELNAARQIQSDLLPKSLPHNRFFSMDAVYIPSEDVGGDFYDYIPLNREESAILIGDASGKGMPAALLISQIQAILKNRLSNAADINNIVGSLNDYLNKNTSPKNFVTLFFGIYNFKTGELRYINAGHNYPVICRGNGVLDHLKTTGPALGLGTNVDFQPVSVILGKDSFLFMYTDGVTESRNANREEFGKNELKKILLEIAKKTPSEIVSSIMKKLNDFRSPKYEQDDTTIMVLKRN